MITVSEETQNVTNNDTTVPGSTGPNLYKEPATKGPEGVISHKIERYPAQSAPPQPIRDCSAEENHKNLFSTTECTSGVEFVKKSINSKSRRYFIIIFYLCLLFIITGVPLCYLFPEKKLVSMGLVACVIDFIFGFKSFFSKPMKPTKFLKYFMVFVVPITYICGALYLLLYSTLLGYYDKGIGITVISIASLTWFPAFVWAVFNRLDPTFTDYERQFTILSALLGALAVITDLVAE